MKKKQEHQKERDTNKNRRNVVKGVTLGLGGVTLTEWSKPVVQSIVLPAHAQTSPNGDIEIRQGSTSGTFTFP